MKTNGFLITALVLASSSVAMADSTFTVRARASVNFNAGSWRGPFIRDHRTTQPSPPVSYPSWQMPSEQVRPYQSMDTGRYEDFHSAAPLPAVTGPTWNCQNWDPSIERSSICAAYASSDAEPLPVNMGGYTAFGVRDSAVPDHQFITVGAGKTFREIVIEGNDGAPRLTKVAIKFTDGSIQVVNTRARLRDGRSISLFLDGGAREINQMVFYTPAGSTGSYSVLGL